MIFGFLNVLICTVAGTVRSSWHRKSWQRDMLETLSRFRTWFVLFAENLICPMATRSEVTVMRLCCFIWWQDSWEWFRFWFHQRNQVAVSQTLMFKGWCTSRRVRALLSSSCALKHQRWTCKLDWYVSSLQRLETSDKASYLLFLISNSHTHHGSLSLSLQLAVVRCKSRKP